MSGRIHYTFSHNSTTNWTTHFQHVLQIPVATINGVFEVGFVELKQCLQAIVAELPGNTSRLLKDDFTIDVYEHGHRETFLAGEGTWSMAFSSLNPQAETVIPGRIRKAVPALMDSVMIEDRLEVELRFVSLLREDPDPEGYSKLTAEPESRREPSSTPSGGSSQTVDQQFETLFEDVLWDIPDLHQYKDVFVDGESSSQPPLLSCDVCRKLFASSQKVK